jgi:hypothetical protein
MRLTRSVPMIQLGLSHQHRQADEDDLAGNLSANI